MFKKLRIKFIAITMAMVAVVMALAFSAVCATEYQRSVSLVQSAMHESVQQVMNAPAGSRQAFRDSDGRVRQGGFGQEWGSSSSASAQAYSQAASANSQAASANSPEAGANAQEASANSPDANADSFEPPRIGMREGQQRAANSIIPLAVYRVENGTASLVREATSAAISDDVLADAEQRALASSDGQGTFAEIGLHYYKVTRDDGVVFLSFADTSTTDQWKSLAVTLGIAGLITLAVFFVISLFYSRWALKPIREAWDLQRQFVADASHDLKTPLTVILANASILLKHPDHSIASESQWIESTQVEAQNMQGLVNEMLELAQVESTSQLQVEMEDVDFSDLADGATLLFDSVSLERNCTFDCEIEPGVSVKGNEQQLQKMVSTLLENAFKYVDAQGSVSVSLKKSGKHAALSVCNSGSVISAEDLPHIFDRFYRTDKARTSGAGGFGLGLAIAREIARAHGGDITCTSTEASGTTFTASLPCA